MTKARGWVLAILCAGGVACDSAPSRCKDEVYPLPQTGHVQCDVGATAVREGDVIVCRCLQTPPRGAVRQEAATDGQVERYTGEVGP